MMKRPPILLSFFVALCVPVLAEETGTKEATGQTEGKSGPVDTDFENAVNAALKAVHQESPQVHEDALRVWKNFTSTSKQVNFTYRFWGRRLILWLKEQKKMAFQSEEQVGDVFKVLWRKGLISKNAVVVLMVDAWSHLIYLEGSPSWEKRAEDRRPEGGTAPKDFEEERRRKEQAV